jgi:hypothetical protein
MSTMNLNATNSMVAARMKANAAQARVAAGDAEKLKTPDRLSTSDITKLNIAGLQSFQTGTYMGNISLGKGNNLTPAQLACVQYMDVLRDALAIATQAGSGSETSVSRAVMQTALNGQIARANEILATAVNQSTGAQLLNGSVVNVASTASANLTAIFGDLGNTNSMTAITAADANAGIQALVALNLTAADKVALNALAAHVASRSNTAAEFIGLASEQISTIKLDSQLNLGYTNNVAKGVQLMKIMAGAAGLYADAVVGGAVATNIPAMVAALLGEATLAGNTITAVAAPAGAAAARSALATALLTETDKAALRAYVARGGAGDVAAGNAAGLTVPEMLGVLNNIGFMQDLLSTGVLTVAGAATNLFGAAGGAGTTIAAAGIFVTTRATAGNPMQQINVGYTTAIRNNMNAGRAATISVSANATVPVQMKNLGAANLGILGLNIIDTTGAAGTGAVTAINNALAQLTAAISSFNNQVTTLGGISDNLRDAKESYDSTASDITKSDSVAIGSFLASIQRANKMLLSLLMAENNIAEKAEQIAEQIANN